MSELRKKKKYTASSHFVRAALDFAKSESCFKSFGPAFDNIPKERRFDELSNAAKKLFAEGYVKEAYLHVNNVRIIAMGLCHEFNITFAKLPSGHYPHMRVVIQSEKALRERADFYRSESHASLGSKIRKPKVKKGGASSPNSL